MQQRLYKNGDLVDVSGEYLCTSCGNIVYFQAGERFRECNICFAGSSQGPEGYREGVEFWKLIS